jgi:hypothetical protein
MSGFVRRVDRWAARCCLWASQVERPQHRHPRLAPEFGIPASGMPLSSGDCAIPASRQACWGIHGCQRPRRLLDRPSAGGAQVSAVELTQWVTYWAADVPRSRHYSFVTADRLAQRGVDVGFAEPLLEVIDSARRTATYKLALLMALLDLCARHSDAEGRAPALLHTRDIAEQVAFLYWPQVIPYQLPGTGSAVELRQITLPRAAIVQAISAFRHAAAAAGTTSWHLARQRLPGAYESMLDKVEVTVAAQPLPRLQAVGSAEAVFPPCTSSAGDRVNPSPWPGCAATALPGLRSSCFPVPVTNSSGWDRSSGEVAVGGQAWGCSAPETRSKAGSSAANWSRAAAGSPASPVTYRRAQDASRGRLHQAVAAGLIQGFVHSYLGMPDARLPCQSPIWSQSRKSDTTPQTSGLCPSPSWMPSVFGGNN